MINIKDKINVEELSNFLAFANTPNFLYNNFILDKGIFDISQKISEAEYISIFDDFLNKKEYSLDDFTLIYALIFSSIHKKRTETISILNHKLIEKLKWGNHLKQIILSNQKIDNSLAFNFEFKPESTLISKSASNVTVTNIKIEKNENNN